MSDKVSRQLIVGQMSWVFRDFHLSDLLERFIVCPFI
jgi:hypothetical protein